MTSKATGPTTDWLHHWSKRHHQSKNVVKFYVTLDVGDGNKKPHTTHPSEKEIDEK